jgi:Zn finger protein HypA/HybF involved in hydrogenase expression
MKYNKELLEPIIKNSKSNREVILKLGLKEAGGNYATIKRLIIKFGLDVSHFTGPLWNKGFNSFSDERIKSKYSLDEIFSENSLISNDRLKQILFSEKLIENKCCECGNNGEWLGKPISLELDHINGVNNDNRIINLRILCPNCHSQTPTFRKKKSSLKKDV